MCNSIMLIYVTNIKNHCKLYNATLIGSWYFGKLLRNLRRKLVFSNWVKFSGRGYYITLEIQSLMNTFLIFRSEEYREADLIVFDSCSKGIGII